jgi:threonine synthase
MNVGHPSNLARLVDAYGGWMDELGGVKQPPDMERMRRDLYSISINDEQTRATIKSAYEKYKTILEPHGAVGWAGLEHYLAERGGQEPLSVSVETAHPAKFPEEIQTLLGLEPAVPPALQGMEDKPEHWEPLKVEYEAFRDMLLARYGTRHP